MPEEPRASASRPWLRWRYVALLLVVVTFGVWMAVDAWHVLGRTMVTLPDGTRVVFERVSAGAPVSPPPSDWPLDVPCFQHDDVQLEGGPWARQWLELYQKIPKQAQGWLPKPAYKVAPMSPRTKPRILILHFSGELEGSWDAWLRDGNGFEFKPEARVFRTSSTEPQGKLVLDAYVSRRAAYQVVFRPHHDDGNALSITRPPAVATLECANPVPVTAPALSGGTVPLMLPVEGGEVILNKLTRRKSVSDDGRGDSTKAAGLWAEFTFKRGGLADSVWDFPMDGFRMADGAGNALVHEPMIAKTLERPEKRYVLYGRGPLLSDDDTVQVRLQGWRTSRDPPIFADDELFHFTDIPGPGPQEQQLSMAGTARGRELKIVKVSAAGGRMRQGMFFFEGKVAREERLAIVEAHDDHGRKLLRNFDPKTGQVWTDYCAGDSELAFNVALADDAKTFSVTAAIVKPVVAEFLVKPEVVE